MNWCTIWENVISGILVVAFGGVAGWLSYLFGIRGKERAQKASQRKQEIYIPLKYEYLNTTNISNNIWQEISLPETEKIVSKNDELVVREDIYQKCNNLMRMISKYNSIDLYSIASDILCKRFEEKYIEVYGGKTHIELHYLIEVDAEVEVEETDYEIFEFYKISCNKDNLDRLFKFDHENEIFINDDGHIEYIDNYLSTLFGSVLPKGDEKYARVKFDEIKNKALLNKKISPSAYFAHGFDFFEEFYNDADVKQKKKLLKEIKEFAFSLFEDIQEVIKKIGKRYERE